MRTTNYNPNEKTMPIARETNSCWLQSGKTITPFEALQEFNCMRLQAIIHEIEQKGYSIIRDWFVTPSGKKVRSYKLA